LEKKPEEEEKFSPIDNKDDFLKKLEALQAGLDKKIDKIKTEESTEKNFSPLLVINSTKSMDFGSSKISLNGFRAGLKKNFLDINPDAEKSDNIPKKILTPSGNFIRKTPFFR